MVKDRIAEIDSNINMALQGVRQVSLLKNTVVAEVFYRKFKEDRQDISFSELEKIPRLKSLPLPTVKGGTIITTNVTRNRGGAKLFFEVCWTAGATLVMHQHSDAEERIKIRKGLFSLITINANGGEDRFTLRSGDVIHIGHGEFHQITALEKGRMEIKFTKSNGTI